MSNLDRLYLAEGIVMPPPLNRAEWLLVKFWEKWEWEKWAKEEKEKGNFQSGVQGAGVNSSWMEDENGNRVSLARQREIMDEVRRTWITLRSIETDLKVYGNTNGFILNFFRAKLESTFQEFRLCANHWKADRVWIENFSSWKNQPETRLARQSNGNQTPQPQTQSAKVSGFQ